MALNPVTGNPYTNEDKAAMAKFNEKFPPVAQGVPTGTFVKANWSNAGVAKASGSAKRPEEQRPNKGANPNRVIINKGMKLSFRKTRKSKSRKSKSRSRSRSRK
jgi:hypothetical protein